MTRDSDSSWHPKWLLVGALLVARCVMAEGQPDIDACLQRLDPQTDIGFDRISARCPDLARQLEQSGWAAWLPRGWKEPRNDLSAGSLKEMRDLARRELATRTSARIPDARSLSSILAASGDAAVSRGWWARLKAWLRSLLESRPESEGDDWLARTIARVGFPQPVIEVVSYLALAAVVALAGLIVVNELRAAGFLARAARRHAQAKSQGSGGEWGWRDIEGAPARDRPRLLLELILARLSNRGQLPPSGGLTVRELTRVIRLPGADDRARFAGLALTAERVRYAGVEPPAVELDESVAKGRTLLERLDAGAPPLHAEGAPS